MTSGYRPSPWGKSLSAPQPEPDPPSVAPEPVQAPARRIERSKGIREPLAQSIGAALAEEILSRKMTLKEFQSLTGVCVSSVRAHRYGAGLRLDTLQKYAEVLGWTVSIQDKDGNDIGSVGG